MRFLSLVGFARLGQVLAVIVSGTLLAACQPSVLRGQAVIEGTQPDWHGFRARLLSEGLPLGGSVELTADGHFSLSLPQQVSPDLKVEVSNGRYRLQAALTSIPLQVDARSTALTALVMQRDEPLDRQQRLDAVTNVVHALFSGAAVSAPAWDQQTPLLKHYVDSWQLVLAVAGSDRHLSGFQLRYHDQLANSYALLNPQASIPSGHSPLNPEMPLMVRLGEQGQPLRWQHLSYTQQSWQCVDYFEHGQRWSPSVVGFWPLGTRLWAVLPAMDGQPQEQVQQQLLRLNQNHYCGHQGWRLPTRGELLSLVSREHGQWDFPLSLPFTDIGQYWIQDDQGHVQVLDLASQMLTDASVAQLLPLSFTADAKPIEKERRTDPVDLSELRRWYSAPRARWPAPAVDDSVQWQELGSLPGVVFPQDNPYSRAAVELGKALFFDINLSRNGNTACASCHLPEQMWSDQRRVSPGTDGVAGRRNAMPVTNTAYNPSLFWDGRVQTLEEQALHPVQDQLEMALTLDELLQRLQANSAYPAMFAAAFGDAQITTERFGKAVATFERTLISQPAAFDRFLAGDRGAMTDQQVWGLHLYRGKARCMNCHSGPLLTDFSFRNTGLTYYGRKLEDSARFAQTFRRNEMGAFRVPSLRDIQYSAPYMHNGVFPVLARQSNSGSVGGVLPMYNAGMTKGRNANYPQYQHKYDPFFPVVDELIQPLGMSNEEILALAAFLDAVSAPPRKEPASPEVLANPALELPPQP